MFLGLTIVNMCMDCHRKNVYSLDRPFQWDIVHLKQRLYEKVMTPGS
jgi:hypothetical protein